MVVLAAVVIGMMIGQNTANDETTEKRNVVVNEQNVQEIIDEMGSTAEAPPVAPGYYTVTMNNPWHFSADDMTSTDAYVANDAKNTNDVFFDVVLEEDEEKVIYKSPVIPLGANLQGFTLDEKLDVGTYNCIVLYNLVDENQKTVDTVRVRVTVVIEG